MKYIINIKKSAQKELAKIEDTYQNKIIEKIYELADDPYKNSKKLTAREAYRIRVGNYRVIYEIENKKLIILVIKIGHRREIYK